MDDVLHLGSDAFHFAQSEAVNFPWGHSCRRLDAHEKAVHGFALRQLPNAYLIPCRRQIVLEEKFFQLTEGWNHGGGDGLLRFLAEARTVRFGNRSGITRERFIERARLWVANNLMVDLSRNSLEDNFRQHHPRFDALAHQCDGLIHVGWEGAETRQPILEILERLEAQRIRQFIFGLNSSALVEGD